MFDFSWGELLLIGVVALIVIGPKELPGVLRTIGQWVARIRRMAGEFQSQFHEAMREAEMADLKKHVDELNDAARGLTKQFDPLSVDTTASRPPEVPAASSTAPAPASADAAAPSTDMQSAQSGSSAPEPAPVAEKHDAATASQSSSPEPVPQEAEGGPRA